MSRLPPAHSPKANAPCSVVHPPRSPRTWFASSHWASMKSSLTTKSPPPSRKPSSDCKKYKPPCDNKGVCVISRWSRDKAGDCSRQQKGTTGKDQSKENARATVRRSRDHEQQSRLSLASHRRLCRDTLFNGRGCEPLGGVLCAHLRRHRGAQLRTHYHPTGQ